MNKKVIWYLHPYAGSPLIGMSYRPYYLAREIQRLGFSPYVISSGFHHLLTRSQQQTKTIFAEQLDGVPYLWLKTPKYAGNGIGRILNMFAYALRLKLHAKQLIKMTGRPDVIIVSSAHPLHYLSARLIAKKYNAKLIFEVRDLWPLSLIEILGAAENHPFVKLLGWIEKKAYQEADLVVSVLPNALEYMQAKGLAANRFVYIPNGVAVDEVDQNKNQQFPEIEILRHQNKFIIGYTGAHGKPNALEQLVEALRLLQAQGHHHVHAVLVGEGEVKAELKNKAKDLRNIIFLNAIPKVAIASFLAQINAAFIGWKALPIYQFGISPNKIFDYMLASKPIIHAINMKNDPVRLAQCGVTVPAESPQALAKAILEVSLLPKDKLISMGLNGRVYVEAHHDYKVLAKQYAELF